MLQQHELLEALRVGNALRHKVRWRFSGLVGFLTASGMFFAQSRGWLVSTDEPELVAILEAVLEIALCAFGVYTIPATTEKLGFSRVDPPLRLP